MKKNRKNEVTESREERMGLKRGPATHREFAENPGGIDRLASERHHRGDGTVHLGLPSQCSEGPCSNSIRIEPNSSTD